MASQYPNARIAWRAVGVALFVNLIWINASEVFRYFAFVMPMTREALPMVPDVAPMSLSVFLIWGVWDTVLLIAATVLPWLFMERFGSSVKVAVIAGSFVWMTVFVILWLGLWNMNLTTVEIVAVALPLAWIEMLIAALIVRWAVRRDAN